jgi:uroporphyrinogen decarboxylase
MTPKERTLTAINHEEPDRVPIVMGVSNATGINIVPYRQLKAIEGIDSPDRYLYEWPELGTADPDERIMERLHADVRGVLDREPQDFRTRNKNRVPHSNYVDSWGVQHGEIKPGVWFPTIHPLAEATNIAALESYPWPDMDDPTRVEHARARVKNLAEDNYYAVMGTPWLLFPFERAFAMQGMDAFLTNMALQPDFAEALLIKNARLCKQLMGNFLRETGEYLDIIKIGDDLGTQESLLISPGMYRKILKPIHADYIAFIKERTKAKVFFHTDGDVFPLIEDFIEIGVDILNPIQTSAGKMSNLVELKRRYGKDIVLCGAIDTHSILPSGTPQQVNDEVKRVIEILAPGGGYMVSSVHTIMDDVPAENILAMVDAVERYGHYPICV